MKASELRDLTRKYAGGKLGREEYLAERARLIGGVVAGDIELHYRELEPAGARRDSARAQKHWLLPTGSVLLVGLLIIALLAYFIDGEDTRRDTGNKAVAAPVVENPGALRLDAFMSAGDWSETALAQLEKDWVALSAFHQENARRSPSFQRLKYETSQRITEQQALLTAGKMEALLQATRLREFAEQLGIKTDK
ncbi:MAG TPA: hypothetical protein VF275_04265 [Gammaproteobacteria bacterium]